MSKKRISVEDRINTPITRTITEFISQPGEKSQEDQETNERNKVIEKEKHVLDSNTNEEKSLDVNNAEKNEPIITHTKRIQVGNDVFKSVYTSSDVTKRVSYELRQDTIDKMHKCAKLSGLKKAEFVDLILNNVLTDILNKVDK